MSPARKKPAWVTVVRAIILGIIALTLVCGVLLGAVTQSFADTRPGDAIDGKPISTYAQQTTDIPDIMAEHAALATKDGRILYTRAADERMPMASTTKIMTAVVGMENNELDKPMTVTVGAATAGGSSAGLEAGDVLLFSDALYALMVPSGNDAAVLIAENTSGTEGKFVALMNAKAEELGMASTHFADASGLTAEDHYTTASDYLTIVAYAMRIPLFREIVATQYKEIEVGDRTLELVTTDKLFEVLETGEALGVKTGFVDEAGYCFAGAARKDGVELYAMIINAPDDMQRFYDAAALLEWGFRHYRPVELLNSSQQVATVALTSWMDKTVDVYIPAAVRVELLDLNGDIRQDVEAYGVEGSVARGQVLGRIVWQHGGETIATSDLVAAESVAEPGFWEGVQIWWSRFFGGFSGEPAHAEGKVLLPASVPVPPAP